MSIIMYNTACETKSYLATGSAMCTCVNETGINSDSLAVTRSFSLRRLFLMAKDRGCHFATSSTPRRAVTRPADWSLFLSCYKAKTLRQRGERVNEKLCLLSLPTQKHVHAVSTFLMGAN